MLLICHCSRSDLLWPARSPVGSFYLSVEAYGSCLARNNSQIAAIGTENIDSPAINSWNQKWANDPVGSLAIGVNWSERKRDSELFDAVLINMKATSFSEWALQSVIRQGMLKRNCSKVEALPKFSQFVSVNGVCWWRMRMLKCSPGIDVIAESCPRSASE